MRRRISAGRVCGIPATAKRPPLGARIVVSTRIAVVLPAPLGPSRPITSPAPATKLSSCSATSGPVGLREGVGLEGHRELAGVGRAMLGEPDEGKMRA